MDTVDKEFEELIKEYDDCPEELFKLAKTSFEKGVVVEFFKTHEKIDNVKKDIGWLKWMIKGIFGVTLLAIVAQIILRLI